MYSIKHAGRGTSRRPFPAATIGPGLVLVVLAVLASSHALFPFFPLLPLALLLLAARGIGGAAWRASLPSGGRRAASQPALPPSGICKEKELLQALERHGGLTAARAALETSLSVSEAEEMLAGLAVDGHVRVDAKDGRIAYALSD